MNWIALVIVVFLVVGGLEWAELADARRHHKSRMQYITRIKEGT